MQSNTKYLLSVPTVTIAKVLMLFAVMSLMTACGKKHGDEKSSQSVVSVNGDEITVHQINNELQRGNVQPAQQEAAIKQIVQGLVDRQILVQAALKEKLDRKPPVMQAIENAKTQILAQAYLQNRVSSLVKPTSTEIADYRTQHVDIFANRKIYMTDEAVFSLDAGNTEQLQSIVKSAKTLKEVEQWLSAHQVKFAQTRVAHAAETLPPQLLTKFSQMALGQIVFINASGASGASGRTMAVSMAEVKEMPILEKDSKPLIEKILTEQKAKLTAEAEMKRLRGEAKIKYINKKYDPANVAKAEKPIEVVKPVENAGTVAKRKLDDNIAKGLPGI